MHPQKPTMRRGEVQYIRQIDGMRALAVVAVVLFHAVAWPWAGYAGVDVFFVISGFLITRILAVERMKNGRVDLAAFYVRRIKRLLPGLLPVLGITIALFMTPPFDYGDRLAVMQSAAASLVFVGNIFFELTSGGYFDVAATRLPLLHLWSLGVEEQFYLVWPFVLILAGWRLRRLSGCRLLGVVLVSFLFSEWLVDAAPQAAFYEMPSRFWELGLGGLVALLPQRHARFDHCFVNGGLVVLLSSLAVAVPHFPGLGAVPVAGATSLLLAGLAGVGGGAVGGRLLAMRPLRLLGRLSYPFYLWHWPLMVLVGYLPGGNTPMCRLLASIVALILAYASDRWIERPLRRAVVVRQGPLVLATVLATVSVAGLAWTAAPLLRNVAPVLDAASRVASDMPSTIVGCHFRGDEPVEAHGLDTCFSNLLRPARLILWGDSHALAMQPFAWMLADRTGLGALELTRDSCPPIRGVDNGKHALEARRCVQFNEMAFAYAVTADTVLLAARWPEGKVDEAYAHALEQTVAALALRVRRIIILGPTPGLPITVPDCIRGGLASACRVSRRAFLQSVEPMWSLLARVASTHKQVQLIDPTSFFCKQSYCEAMRDGVGLYWDDNHVSATAAREFAKAYLSVQAPVDPLKTISPASTKQISPQQYKPPNNK